MTSGAHSNMAQSSPPSTSVPPSTATPASPPSKRDLKSWWKNFKLPIKQQDTQHDTRGPGIFGVPLRTSITYANVAISLVDENGKSYIYGYVPIVVAKCGVFLKEKATSIEGIFRLSGSEKRIKELKIIFDSPDRYGKGLVWDGYTVHDAANVLRRYLNDLPEPVVPLDLYEKFRDPLRGATKQAVGDAEGPQFVDNFDETAAIEKYQNLITELPPLNKQLLLYILDLLAVFAAKSDENRMTSQNLAAIFQPGMLSHPSHAMAPDEYRLNQCVIIFLIENQDHFLIGMQGTAADETMMREVASTAPNGPFTPNPNRKSSLGRTASNSSAGAESVLRDGKVRRNRSVSSRHSRVDGSATPKSPSMTTTPTGGLARSNTVPSKKSPALIGGKFNKHESPGRLPHSPALEPLTQSHIDEDNLLVAGWSGQERRPSHSRSQDRLLDVPHEAVTPTKDRNPQNSHNLFQRPTHELIDKRQPNKLKKKRIPGTINISAQSSSNSLPHSNSKDESPDLDAAPDPVETPPYIPHSQAQPIPQSLPSHSSHFGRHAYSASTHSFTQRAPPQTAQSERYTIFPVDNHDGPADLHRHARVFSHSSLRPEDTSRGKKSPAQSIHSSYNDGSDLDQVVDEVPVSTSSEHVEKEKRHRWRISKSKKEDFTGFSGSPLMPPHMNIGANYNAEISTTSIGSALNKSRKSFTGDSSEQLSLIGDRATSHDHESGKESSLKDDPKGPFSWIKTKYREAKENVEQMRAKSPPPSSSSGAENHHHVFGPNRQAPRGKSLDLKRENFHHHRDDERRTLREVPPDSPVGSSSSVGKFAHDNNHRETWRNHVSSKSSNAELVSRVKGGAETVVTIATVNESSSKEEARPRTAESKKQAAMPSSELSTTPEEQVPQAQEPAAPEVVEAAAAAAAAASQPPAEDVPAQQSDNA